MICYLLCLFVIWAELFGVDLKQDYILVKIKRNAKPGAG